MTDPAPHPLETVPPGVINWRNLFWSALAIAVMIATIIWDNFQALNFLHVTTGLLWTGIDLFMGFVIGPVLRAIPFEMRRAVVTRITPKTLFILPVLAIATGTTGWYLAAHLGYLDTPWPGYWWVVAALVVNTVLAVQGIGILLPMQLRVYFEMIKPEPDRERIGRLSASYFYLIASQGVMQVGIVVIMAKFRAGL